MTRIDFYSGPGSRLDLACQLTAKAYRKGLKVVLVTGDEPLAQKIDRQLWTFHSTGFLPHCRSHHQLASVTPVIIAPALEGIEIDEVLVNLATECPPGFARFQRVVEVIGDDESERQAGRLRWRHYRERGYLVNHVDVSRERSGQPAPEAVNLPRAVE